MKIEKSKLKLKKILIFSSFLLQIYRKYILKPNFIFKLFSIVFEKYSILSLTYINIIKNQKM